MDREEQQRRALRLLASSEAALAAARAEAPPSPARCSPSARRPPLPVQPNSQPHARRRCGYADHGYGSAAASPQSPITTTTPTAASDADAAADAAIAAFRAMPLGRLGLG